MNRIFSGVQPTGNLHIGNYLGAIRNWVNMQNDYECIFCIVDLHAITVPQDPDALRAATREVTAAFIACGVDAKKHTIFNQSASSVHAELAWILSCHTPLGWLNRMTQFKEKTGTKSGLESSVRKIKTAKKYLDSTYKSAQKLIKSGNEGLVQIGSKDITRTHESLKETVNELEETLSKSDKANLGLFSYPVLMAADILGYRATHVPVGEDQKQHLELSRDIAGAFNRQYGQDFFPLPEPVITGTATRVMSLRDGTKKMSKSDPSDYSRINLTDDADTIAKKFKKAKSDVIEGLSWDPENRPEAANLINLFSAFTGENKEAIVSRYETAGFAPFKKDLADAAVAHLSPITSTMRELLADPAYIDSVLKKGAEQANEMGQSVLADVKDIVGFLRV